MLQNNNTEHSLPIEEDKIEMGLRLLGNEILGFYVNSASRKKSWLIISMIILVLLAILANQLLPIITLLSQTI